jgi:general secretion pathway protein D
MITSFQTCRTSIHIAVSLFVFCALPGCKTFQELVEPIDTEVGKMLDAGEILARTSTRVRLGNQPDGNEFEEEEPAITPPLTIVLPSRNLEPPAELARKRAYSLAEDMIDEPDEPINVDFTFDAEELSEVVKMFALTLKFQYYIDPAVSGSINLNIHDENMPRRQAWQLFEHILWMNGSYASRDSGFVNILPFGKMPQERRVLTTHKPSPNVDVSFIRLYHTTPAEISTLIRPFMTAGATAQPINHLNSIMIVESPPNMDKIRELIAALDELGETRWPQISIATRHVDVNDIQQELSRILSTIGFPVITTEKGDGRSIKIVALERPQILLVAAPTREVLSEVQKWVDILDKGAEIGGDQEVMFEYKVKYNRADELAAVVSAFFSSVSSTTTSVPRATDQSDDSSRRLNRQNQSTTPRAATPRAPSSSQGQQEIHSIYDTPVILFADGSHNRLIIRTTPRAYAHLLALLEKLDTPPLQVMIQMYIVDIELSEATSFGFRYAFQTYVSNHDLDFQLKSVADEPNFALELGRQLTAADVLNTVSAVAGKGKTRVLSTPQITVISDRTATIDVGDSVPIATDTTIGADTTTVSRSEVAYVDTGTRLEVTPSITARGMVKLDITGEVSKPEATTSSSIDSPTIATSRITSTLIVEDGATIMLGGLIRRDEIDSSDGVPFLQDIPGIGVLFRGQSDTDSRREVLLLITVKVLELETDYGKLMERYQRALELLADEYPDIEVP